MFSFIALCDKGFIYSISASGSFYLRVGRKGCKEVRQSPRAVGTNLEEGKGEGGGRGKGTGREGQEKGKGGEGREEPK